MHAEQRHCPELLSSLQQQQQQHILAADGVTVQHWLRKHDFFSILSDHNMTLWSHLKV